MNFQHRFPPQPLRVRIVIAGAEGVGKSCIIKRFLHCILNDVHCCHHYIVSSDSYHYSLSRPTGTVRRGLWRNTCQRLVSFGLIPLKSKLQILSIGELQSSSLHIKIARNPNTHQIYQALTMEQPVSLLIRGR